MARAGLDLHQTATTQAHRFGSRIPAHIASVTSTWPGMKYPAKRRPPLSQATTHLLRELLLIAIKTGMAMPSRGNNPAFAREATTAIEACTSTTPPKTAVQANPD